jgi:uncharacterized damage-inducible protein DinB
MEITRIDPFLHYYGRLRQRTLAVVECIPPERIEWAPAEGAFSFADVLRHVAGIERYVFAENAHGRGSRYPGHGRELADGHAAVLEYLERMHRETLELLRPLEPEELERRIPTLMGNEIPVWKWLRALAEHEVHHRGQLYLMLRLIGVPTPPLYGLTSEEVRERGGR